MTIKRILIYGLFLLALGVLAWPKVHPLLSTTADNTEESQSQNRLPVEAVTLEPEVLEDIIYSSGSLRANEVVDLRAEMAGMVTEILFEEGRPVEQGQLLLKINDNELQAQRRRAQFQLNLAEQREVRQQRLLERGGVSQEEYDETVNQVNVLRSELELIDAQIEKTEIRAPFDGHIGLKFISPGSFITSETNIATLNDISQVKIDFSIPERYVTRVDVGDRIEFTVQGYDSTFVGEVYAVEPRIDDQTRTLRIRAISDNPDRMLVPGAFANIELILETIDNALMIPAIAVLPELNRQKVFVYNNGVAEEREVTTGIRTDRAVQVVEGLAPGDTVLTTGLLQVRPGMPVDLTQVTNSSHR